MGGGFVFQGCRMPHVQAHTVRPYRTGGGFCVVYSGRKVTLASKAD